MGLGVGRNSHSGSQFTTSLEEEKAELDIQPREIRGPLRMASSSRPDGTPLKGTRRGEGGLWESSGPAQAGASLAAPPPSYEQPPPITVTCTVIMGTTPSLWIPSSLSHRFPAGAGCFWEEDEQEGEKKISHSFFP